MGPGDWATSSSTRGSAETATSDSVSTLYPYHGAPAGAALLGGGQEQ